MPPPSYHFVSYDSRNDPDYRDPPRGSRRLLFRLGWAGIVVKLGWSGPSDEGTPRERWLASRSHRSDLRRSPTLSTMGLTPIFGFFIFRSCVSPTTHNTQHPVGPVRRRVEEKRHDPGGGSGGGTIRGPVTSFLLPLRPSRCPVRLRPESLSFRFLSVTVFNESSDSAPRRDFPPKDPVLADVFSSGN